MPKIKAYQQIEHSDCGITCIRIIARYYGRVVPLSFLRDMCDFGRMGMSLRDIVSCMKKLGFCTAAVRIGEAELKRMPLPAIIYWDQCHYVVLYKIKRDGELFYIADPARGKVRLSKEEFFHHWQMHNSYGLAVVADPTEDFYKLEYPQMDSSNVGLWKLVGMTMRDNHVQFAAIVVLMILAMIADVVSPMLFQQMIDEGIGGLNISLVWLLVLGQFAVFFGSYISSCMTDLLLNKMSLKMGIRMVNDYLLKLVSLPMSFFDSNVVSDLVQKIDDQNRLKTFLLEMPQSLLFAGANLIVFSFLVTYYSPLAFAIFVSCMALSFLWTQLHMSRRKTIDYSYFSYSSENRNNVYELINGMQDVKVNNARQMRVDIWSDVQKKINALSMRSAYLNMSVNGGNSFLARFRDIAITGFCATMVVRGSMSIGEMMTITYLVGRLDMPLNNLVSMLNHMQEATISYNRIMKIMDSKTEGDLEKIAPNLSDSVSLRFEDVSFKYPGSYSPFVINNLSVTIPAGKMTAVVGVSGCGKSTFIKLLLGFYRPQQGVVMVDGINLSTLDSEQWLACCGVVMQNGYIFSGTILENIALSDKHPNMERVREAARLACVDDFFKDLPMGYYTRLGNAGMELSGGQRQRLFIARAIYRNPSLLVLDEATSSLDANNESNIVRNLSAFNAGRTVVVAAHRLSTVRHADNIIFMDKGRVVEQGTHESLVALRGAYYQLVKEQLEMDD